MRDSSVVHTTAMRPSVCMQAVQAAELAVRHAVRSCHLTQMTWCTGSALGPSWISVPAT